MSVQFDLLTPIIDKIFLWENLGELSLTLHHMPNADCKSNWKLSGSALLGSKWRSDHWSRFSRSDFKVVQTAPSPDVISHHKRVWNSPIINNNFSLDRLASNSVETVNPGCSVQSNLACTATASLKLEVSDCPQVAGDRQVSQPIGGPYSNMPDWCSPPWRSSHKVWRLSHYNFWLRTVWKSPWSPVINWEAGTIFTKPWHAHKAALGRRICGVRYKTGVSGVMTKMVLVSMILEIPLEVCVLSHAMWICSIWSHEKTGFWEVRHLFGLIFHIKILPRLTSSLFSRHTRESKSKT